MTVWSPESPPESTVQSVVGRAFDYLAGKQLGDGCITDQQDELILAIWDSVHALRACALWRDSLSTRHDAMLRRLRTFLRANETPEGLISWGDRLPDEYSGETSSEYITALVHLGEKDDALARARILRSAQLRSGPWRENHSQVPEAFQTMPSVTGFALRVLWLLGLAPSYPDKALEFLQRAQTAEGHWGYNWYYNAVPYYVMMPVAAALARFSCYPPLAKARAYILSQQCADGSWRFDIKDVAGAYSKQLSACVHTVYALETLLSCGLSPDDPPVRRSLTWLLTKQDADGAWRGGTFPYPPTEQYADFEATQDVYATAIVLVLLKRLTEFG
jgi:Squalene-hopene cyclase C-terminal domain